RSNMVESGFFAVDSVLSADDAYRWWEGIIYEILAPQPVTYTDEASRRAVASMLDVREADHPMRHITVPADFVFFSRLNLSMNAIFTALNATFHARGMLDEMDGVAPPVSAQGLEHEAWVQRRGLPHGTDDHVN
ncbi:MAG: AarF/ABC1/UbiB kinase family protein, partial [Actinobacteria bacterium]|nr:AarF/ABC1/UbiB kinase family protein [Actinomycetota bacterium]